MATAQVATRNVVFTSTGQSVPITLVGSAADLNKLKFYAEGTFSSCTVRMEQSADGVSGWSLLGADYNCTSTGESPVVSGIANYVRVSVTAFTGGTRLTVVYSGFRTQVGFPAGGGGGAGGDVNIASLFGFAPAANNYLPNRLTNGTAYIDPRDRNWTITETVPVSGTFWQAVQPVSWTGQSVSVSNFPATQPVSWSGQSVSVSNFPTQDPIDRASRLLGVVYGSQGAQLQQSATNFNLFTELRTGSTAYDARQIRALTASDVVTANQGGTWSIGVNNFPATQAVTQSGTWTVGVNNFPATQPVSGTVTANQGGTWSNVGITPPTLTKGTQGATGFTVQALEDAGRNLTNYFMVIPVVTSATDTLVSLTGYKSGAAVAATTTPAVVTAGKNYRVIQVCITYVAIATAGSVRMTLRANTGGVVAIGSPAVWGMNVGGPAAAAGVSQTQCWVTDMEFAAGTGIGVSQQGYGATQTAAAVGYGQISIVGYEY